MCMQHNNIQSRGNEKLWLRSCVKVIICCDFVNNRLTDIITFFNLKSLCRGHKAMRPIAVVQLGFAINFAPLVLSPLISGTTNGIPSL